MQGYGQAYEDYHHPVESFFRQLVGPTLQGRQGNCCAELCIALGLKFSQTSNITFKDRQP